MINKLLVSYRWRTNVKCRLIHLNTTDIDIDAIGRLKCTDAEIDHCHKTDGDIEKVKRHHCNSDVEMSPMIAKLSPVAIRQGCIQFGILVENLPAHDPSIFEIQASIGQTTAYEYRVSIKRSVNDTEVEELVSKMYKCDEAWDFLGYRSNLFVDENFDGMSEASQLPFTLTYRNKRCHFEDVHGRGMLAPYSYQGKHRLVSLDCNNRTAVLVHIASCILNICVDRDNHQYQIDDGLARRILMDYIKYSLKAYLGSIIDVARLYRTDRQTPKLKVDQIYVRNIFESLSVMYEVLIKPAKGYLEELDDKSKSNEEYFYISGQEEADELDQTSVLFKFYAMFEWFEKLAMSRDILNLTDIELLSLEQNSADIIKHRNSIKAMLFSNKRAYKAVIESIEATLPIVQLTIETSQLMKKLARETGSFWRVHSGFVEDVLNPIAKLLLEDIYSTSTALVDIDKFVSTHRSCIYYDKNSDFEVWCGTKILKWKKLPCSSESDKWTIEREINFHSEAEILAQRNSICFTERSSHIHTEKILYRLDGLTGIINMVRSLDANCLIYIDEHQYRLTLVSKSANELTLDIFKLDGDHTTSIGQFDLKLYLGFDEDQLDYIKSDFVKSYENPCLKRSELQIRAQIIGHHVLLQCLDYRFKQGVFHRFYHYKLRDRNLRLINHAKIAHSRVHIGHSSHHRFTTETFTYRHRLATILISDNYECCFVFYHAGHIKVQRWHSIRHLLESNGHVFDDHCHLTMEWQCRKSKLTTYITNQASCKDNRTLKVSQLKMLF